MNSQLCLFSQEIDETPPAPSTVTCSRKTIRKSTLLGRCTRCGAHIAEDPGFCQECLNLLYCNCHECLQIASIHRMLQNDLYWERRSVFADMVYLRRLSVQAEETRLSPKCKEAA
jgi:predicted amidophosphoribosyltransferase